MEMLLSDAMHRIELWTLESGILDSALKSSVTLDQSLHL